MMIQQIDECSGKIKQMIENDPELKKRWEHMISETIKLMEESTIEIIKMKSKPTWVVPGSSGVKESDLK